MTTDNNMTPYGDFDLEFDEATTGMEPVKIASEAELPDKYKGKTALEIAQMHMNAEKRLSKLGNELGTLRNLSDEVLNLKKNQEKVSVPNEPRKPLTVDEIFADPDKAIQQTIGQSDVAKKADEAVGRVDSLEKQLALREFEARHPTYKDDLNDQTFQEWVTGNKARVELFRRADAFDVDSADALWQMWGEHKQLKEVAEKREAARQKRERTLAAGKTIPDASSEPRSGGPTYSRAKLMELQRAAHSGDFKARSKWQDPAFQDELLKAYSEGRVK